MKDEMRIPLSDILGVPGFLAAGSREQWLRDNRIVLENDWAGRETVDLPTAWRLKRDYDQQYEKARAKAAEEAAENSAARTAQLRREELLGVEFQRAVPQYPGNHSKAIVAARAAVEQQEKDLPSVVRQKLYWPTGIHYASTRNN